MNSSQKQIVFRGVGLIAFIMMLPGGAAASDSCTPSLAALFQQNFSEGWAVSTAPLSRLERSSNGKGEFEEQLRLLLEELKKLEKDAEEKFRKDILPYLKREIEKLRKRLKEFSPGKEEAPQPQRVQA